MTEVRVFPRRTRATPDDRGAVREPSMFLRKDVPVRISVAFTWDLDEARRLKAEWEAYGFEDVELGGPALGDPGRAFEPGRFLRRGRVITSRGCPNRCPGCLVPEREGRLRELEVKAGHQVDDNNVLACSKRHWREVCDMLRTQRRVVFSGGLEAARVTDGVAEDLRALSVETVYLAYDRPEQRAELVRARHCLRAFSRRYLHCYVLIGGAMGIGEAAARLLDCWEIGYVPIAMLWQPAERWIEYPDDWKRLRRAFARPALTRALVKSGWDGDVSKITW